ncbi:glycosyltransferase family 2 protein [bacterium]|nr:glycosyltransferase family 2 protein [bacterium]MBU1754070.1 glycosyltransferase family 2 protein [bacterium]
MLVSFIIPHKGREELLIQTIESIFAMEHEDYQIEVIVVTQNATLECLYAEQKGISYKIIFCPEHKTIASLRNIGVSQSSGEYLAFIDADIDLSQNWLMVMLNELHAKQDRVAVSALQQCKSDAGSIEKIKVILQMSRADQEVEYIGTANLFMSRAIFEQAGGFPEDIVTCEDYYFTQKARQFGKLYVASKASHIHLGEDKNYREVFRKEMWRGQSNLPSMRNRKITFWELPSILLPFWMAFFSFVALFFSIVERFGVACMGCVVVVFPVLFYAARLYLMGKQQHVCFKEAVGFYGVYFFARTIGTFVGLVKGK